MVTWLILRGCIQSNICGKILCKGHMSREHVKSKHSGNTVGKYFADHQLTIENWKWGAWSNHYRVFNPPIFSFSRWSADLQMLIWWWWYIHWERWVSILLTLPFHCYCYWPYHMPAMTNGLVASQILMKFLAIPHQRIYLAIVHHPTNVNVQGFFYALLC